MKKLLDAPPNGEELKEIRLAYNMTRKEMSELLGVGGSTVYFYETGRCRVPYKHVKRLNRLLSTPVPPAAHASLSGDELRILRTSRGLSQQQVAEAFGVMHSAISDYERGKAPIPAGLPECIKGMAIPKDELISSDDSPAPCPLNDLLQQISQSREEERERWLQLGDAVTPAELRQLRQSRGLSLDELADGLGIPKSTLRSYEVGRIRIPKGIVEKTIEVYPYRTITPSELSSLRKALKLPQTYIGKILNFDSNVVQHYESGTRKISYELSRRLLEFFQERAETLSH